MTNTEELLIFPGGMLVRGQGPPGHGRAVHDPDTERTIWEPGRVRQGLCL